MKKTFYFLVLLPILVAGQTQSENYIKTTTYKKPTAVSIATPNIDIASISLTYFDGLGRPIQKIAHKQSATGKDIVTHIEYDDFGRQVNDYLPFVPSSPASLDIKSNEVASFYASNNPLITGNPNFEVTDFPYSQKEFEASPLNRVLKQAAPGANWKMGSGHEVKFDYQLNGENEVINFSVSPDGHLIHYGSYKPNLIYKTIIKNENWVEGYDNTTQEFKDNYGRIILKRAFEGNIPHDTYYVYDRIGNLRFVLPPLFLEDFAMPAPPAANTCNVTAIIPFLDFLNSAYYQGYNVQGGGSAKITIANGVITILFSGGFEPCIVDDTASPLIIDPSQCALPDMLIGDVRMGSPSYYYYAYIENNRLRIAKKNPIQDIPSVTSIGETISKTIDVQASPTTIDTPALDNLCYQYKYDEYNRLVEKKLPGKQWEYIVYNSQDKPVATGPTLNPWGDGTQGWMITKYDIMGRVIYTGWMQDTVDSSSRISFQGLLNGEWAEQKLTSPITIDNVEVSYSNEHYPQSFSLLTTNYYDNYDHAFAPTMPTSILGEHPITNAKGLLTGSWVRVLNSPSETLAEVNHTFYDVKGRVICNQKNNYFGGYSIVENKLDFSGKTEYTKSYHKRTAIDDEIKITDTYEYTPQDRLLIHRQQINSNTEELIVKNDYDELGQLISKQVGGKDVHNYVGLQKVDYQYNIRGWLKGINNLGQLQEDNLSVPKDLFAFKINYTDIQDDVNNQVKPLYNGNIAETFWQSSSDNVVRKYGYQYDNLNRLRKAIYQKPNNAFPVTHMYDEEMTYDKNGNIQHLSRFGELDDPEATNALQIDDLTYVYDTNNKNNNRLLKVTDATGSFKGFTDDTYDSATDNTDYTYDDNGNLLTDENKNITGITYNHLNLPVSITFGTAGTIEYLYNAIGQKVKKKVVADGQEMATDYLEGFQYSDGVLKFFPHAEGYVNATQFDGFEGGKHYKFNYVYYYLDHLGNIRVSYGFDVKSGLLKILEQNHYYPFGLKHAKYNVEKKKYEIIYDDEGNPLPVPGIVPDITPVGIGNGRYNYKYNGKEYQDELGLNMYDYGARNYDPSDGRWWGIDPLAEKSRRFSPYTYALDNPVYFIDPDGMQANDWYRNKETGKVKWVEGSKKISGYSNLGYTWGKTFANGNRILMDGDTKQITYNGKVISDFNKSKPTAEGKDNIALSDGGENRASDSERVRNLSMIDLGGMMDMLLTVFSFDLSPSKPNGKGTNGGKPTSEDKAGDIIDGTDNATNGTKKIIEENDKPSVNDSVVSYDRGDDNKVILESRTSRPKTKDEKKQ